MAITKGLGIKEVAITLREYHQMFIADSRKEANTLKCKIERFKEKCDAAKSDVKDFIDEYKQLYNLDVTKFPEYQRNRYISGEFLRIAKGVYLNRNQDYEITAQTFAVFNLAFLQKKVFEFEQRLKKCEKYAGISYKLYRDLVCQFYTAVHKQLIFKAYGYQYEKGIGFVFINRAMKGRDNKVLDVSATRANKQKLLAEGKNIYNKAKIDWCKEHNIPYDYVDHRVWKPYPFDYEIVLLGRRARYTRNQFRRSRWRSLHLPSKTLEGLIEHCNKDMNKICDLDIDLPSKLSMCLTIDPTMGLKYIRNENQKSYKLIRFNRKSR